MKPIYLLWGALLASSTLQAQTLNQATAPPALPAPTSYAVVSREANSATWQMETYHQENGMIVTNVHRYVELATGLNHLVNGQYLPSSDQIDLSPDGSSAWATNGQHQVYFPGNIYNGMIKLVTPDGQVIESQPIGLAYYDGSNSVLLATVTNSTGAILPSGNEVIYTNAFAGLNGDIIISYTKAGMAQDIVLRQQPPDPNALGLNSAKTRLQMITEFISSPQPGITAITVPTDAGNLEDDALGFGAMQMGRGKAFLIGGNSPSADVEKRWLTIQGRQFLIEEVPIVSIAQAIDSLPPFVSKNGVGTKPVVSKNLILPPQRLVHTSPKTTFLAKAKPPQQGLVLDYVTMISQTNWVFQGDSTYFISGSVYLYGTNTFEGGTVVKYTNGASIYVEGPVNCQTGPYRPAVFTAKDDNSVGEGISGSTGNPLGVYAGVALGFYYGAVLQHLRIEYASTGLEAVHCEVRIKHSQFLNDAGPIVAIQGTLDLENVLIYNVSGSVFNGYEGGYTAQNVTVHNANGLSGWGNIYVTNSLLVCVTNLAGLSGVNNYTNSSDAGIFQTVGAGAHYLATNCPAGIRNAGTTNIDPGLLADLQTKTTYPPMVYSNYTFTTAQTFYPQAQRDTDTPDLGYHYDPLDYVFGGCVANSNVTFTAGTAAGWFFATSGYGPQQGQGIYMQNYTTASFQGTEATPDYWVRTDTVQEEGGANALWQGGYGPGGIIGGDYLQYSNNLVPAPVANLSFTRTSMLGGEGGDQFRDDYYAEFVFLAKHCEFYGSGIGGYGISCYFTNCLMGRLVVGQVAGFTGNAVTMRNCTCIGGQLQFAPTLAIPLSVRDCAFDGTTYYIANYGNGTNTDYDYNAYTNGASQLPTGGTHDVIVTNAYNWEAGPLGNYYLPTNSTLLNKGDVPASQVGLYHFTITTNEIPEGTNIVSIGYHYVALDQYGNPLDSNGDGIPDYLEDANGNGIYDTGDLGDWQDLNLNVIITRPRNGSVLP